ncbi:hypothetical protein D3C81_1530790 [compost metagenome]
MRAGQDRQCPARVLLDLLGAILGKADQGVNHPDREIQGEVHQVGTFGRYHRLEIFLANHPVDLGLFPAIHCLGHEHRLQQITDVLVGFAVHCREDQAIEKCTQSLGDKTTGEGASVTHDRHDIVVLEQGEGWSVGIQPGNRGHAQASHEIVLQHGRVGAHIAVGRVQVDIAGAAIIAGYVGKSFREVVLRRCGHDRLRCFCHYFFQSARLRPCLSANHRPE